MNEKIGKLSRGIIEDRLPLVTLSPESLEGTISQGLVTKADFGVSTEDRFFLRGLIYSSSEKVILQSPYFAGSNTHIAFNIDTTRSKTGEIISGQFNLVTSAGEFIVPYSYTVLRNRELEYLEKGEEVPVLDGGDILRELAEEKLGRQKVTEPETGDQPESKSETDKDFYLKLTEQYRVDSNIYQSFEHQMRNFVRDSILAGEIDDKLIRLYTRVLKPEMIDGAMARALTDILLTCRIEVPERFRKLCIKYREIEEEQTVSLVEGRADFPVYTADYDLYLIDSYGTRYDAKNLKLSPIMPSNEQLLSVCAKSAPDIAVYRIRFAHRLATKKNLDREEMMILYELSSSEGISRHFQSELTRSIICNYDWKNHGQDAFVLVSIAKKDLESDTELDYVKALIDLDLLKDAAENLFLCDYKKIDSKDLRKVCEYIIDNSKAESDDDLLGLCDYLFEEGVAREGILEYLCRFYNGLTDHMHDILIAADEDGLQLFDLPERLLGQMLFVAKYRDMDEVFRIYARGSVTRRLLKAYYCIKCHRYFIFHEPMDPEIFGAIKNILAGELASGDIPLVVSLAVSKYFSEQEKSLSEEDVAITKQIVNRLCRKDIVLPYFKSFADKIDLPLEVLDRTYVDFHGEAEDSVTLILYPENDDAEPYYLEMNSVYDGIFVKSILMYECENFSYEIRVIRKGETFIAKEGELTSGIGYAGGNQKFKKLNRLLIESDRPEDRKWQDAMDEYAKEDSLCAMLFKID